MEFDDQLLLQKEHRLTAYYIINQATYNIKHMI